MIDQATADFLEKRGICQETASKYGIYTDPNVAGMKRSASVIVFPYQEHGTVVNEKFRMLPKERFWQRSGRKKIFWNVDALDDPALEDGRMPLVICEGEMDALAAIQCGFPLSVSVPDGAPPAQHGVVDDGSDERTGRHEYLWNAQARLKHIKRFILAVDADGPGERLREELIRRLGTGRCSFVEYPVGCKDINDVLIKHGPDEVVRTINGAKKCPVRGLYKLSDFPDQGQLETFSTGWTLLDNHFRLFLGEFIVVTGIPQHGKSSWALHLLANLANQHGFRSAIFSPEMKVVPVIRDRFRSIRTKKIPELATPETNAWIEDNFVFIGADPMQEGEDDDFDLTWIIDKAKEAVLRDGIRVLLIDPWNEVEHARLKGETLTEYVARGIRALKRFARAYDVAVIVVAHPVKMAKNRDGNFEVPTLYDISDSANWYNKADHGIVVYRKFDPPSTEICVVKSRFDEAGESGSVRMQFDRMTHRFEPLMGDTV